MTFEILKSSISNIALFIKRIGYMQIPSRKEGKASFIRRIHQTDFPRFHLYLSQNESSLLFDLHMDLLRPKHKITARAAESFGKPVEDETNRIKQIAS